MESIFLRTYPMKISIIEISVLNNAMDTTLSQSICVSPLPVISGRKTFSNPKNICPTIFDRGSKRWAIASVGMIISKGKGKTKRKK
jgi:hypothetical protein